MDSSPAQDDNSIIECGITPWFYRRRAIFAGMYLLAAVLFFKDGIWSWPNENMMAARKEWFEKEVLTGFDKAKTEGTLAEWGAQAKEKHYPLDAQGEPVKWAAYAAQQGWPEKPKRRTEAEIVQQYYWGAGGAVALLLVAASTLYYRKRKLMGYADHLVTATGTKVAFADAFKVDKRKWDLNGLAYVHYRAGGEGSEKKVKIDDLMFDGAGRVLDRLLANFKGELIEKVAEEEPAEPESEPQ